jgi:hypothetical protein
VEKFSRQLQPEKPSNIFISREGHSGSMMLPEQLQMKLVDVKASLANISVTGGQW